ncbi:MAG: hypothetical protein LBF27_14200 [Sphingobacterium sp.]|jgi:hypothetical protein|nr:hypothetical protein [Sphingobacterium sp.]
MNAYLIINILLCTLFKGNDSSCFSNWNKINSNHKVFQETHQFQSDSISVPFIWKNFSKEIFDSLIVKGSVYDSLTRVHQDSLDKYGPESVEMELENAIVVYLKKESLHIGNCDYDAHFFLINEGHIFHQENHYKFCYIKDFGVVYCLHFDTQLGSFEWEKYILTDVKDKSGKTVINKKSLNQIMAKVTKY